MKSQIALGARLVVAIQNNLATLAAGRNVVTWCEVKDLQKQLRQGRRTLVDIRKRLSKVSLAPSL